MKSLKRVVVFVLVAAFIFAVIPAPVAYARPKSFDKSKLTRVRSYPAYLSIGDMTFKGKLEDISVTEAELDKLIEEVLKEMGLTEKDLDDFNAKKDEPYTQEQMNKLRDALTALAGTLPGVGGAGVGVAAKIGQILSMLNQGQYGQAFLTYISFMTRMNPVTGTTLGLYDAFSDLKNIFDMLKELVMSDQQQAGRVVNDFYDRLDEKIKNLDRDPSWYLFFINVTAHRQFSLYGTPCAETWTLNMILPKKTPMSTNDFYGTYEGEFNIDVAYDLAGFHSFMEVNEYNIPASVGGLLRGVDENAKRQKAQGVTVTVETKIIPGTSDVTRTISGNATVRVSPYREDSVKLTTKSDIKNAKVEGIKIFKSFSGEMGGEFGGWAYDISVSADEENFNSKIILKNIYTTTYKVPDVTSSKSSPWDPNIWRRGDKVAQNQPGSAKLTIHKR